MTAPRNWPRWSWSSNWCPDGVDDLMKARSVAIWVCKECGGFAGCRATTGESGRILDGQKYWVMCVGPGRADIYLGEAPCTCHESVCPACARKEGEVNHPTGMIFVGFGIGWQTCSACGGTGRQL